MSLVTVNWNPSSGQLRQFGVACLFASGLLGWALTGDLAGTERFTWVGGAVAVGIVLAVLGWLSPTALRWPFIALTLIVLPIGLVVSEIVLFSMFCLVVTPMALAFRLVGRDPLNRTWNPAAASYWESHTEQTDPARYLRQS